MKRPTSSGSDTTKGDHSDKSGLSGKPAQSQPKGRKGLKPFDVKFQSGDGTGNGGGAASGPGAGGGGGGRGGGRSN